MKAASESSAKISGGDLHMRMRAVYENGVFKPLDTVLLKER
jgi:hypothetical protein